MKLNCCFLKNTCVSCYDRKAKNSTNIKKKTLYILSGKRYKILYDIEFITLFCKHSYGIENKSTTITESEKYS